jgi:hypothetical protein
MSIVSRYSKQYVDNWEKVFVKKSCLDCVYCNTKIHSNGKIDCNYNGGYHLPEDICIHFQKFICIQSL